MASLPHRLSYASLALLVRSALPSRVTERLAGGPPRPFAPNLVAAVLCAIVTLAFAGSFGQLVFDGALAPQVGRGILAALVSSIAMLVILSWRGAYPFSVGGPDSNPSVVLAVTLASLVQQIAATSGPEAPELLPTVLMYVFVSAVGCGLLVWLLGERRGGRYVRYIPHPVVGGFLAGSGYLLVAGAFRSLTGVRLEFATLPLLGDVHPLAGATTFVVAGLLVVLTRKVRHFLVIPTVIVAGVAVFHVARALLGIDLAAAQRAGLLLPPLDPAAWGSIASVPFGDVRWDLVLLHAKDFGAMTVVVVVTALLNATSIELATGQDGDADRELRAIGMANVVAGLCGGMVAGNSFNRTLLNWKAGANSRWAAWLCAAIILGVMVGAPGAVGWLPRPVLTGLILYLGVTLLLAWVIDAGRTLSRMDYGVVLSILVMVAALGIVAGVVFGVFIACVTLAVTLSRSPNVRHAFTAETRRANVERTPAQLERLRAHGGAVRGFSLQGVLFFGTATNLLEAIRQGIADTRIVLLDFRLIHGIDASAIVVMKRVQGVCRDAAVQLVLTGLTPRMEWQLARGGFDLEARHLRRFADLDRGLEWCEEFVLGETDAPRSLAEVLNDALTPVGARLLFQACERRVLAPGEPLVRQGDPSNEMFFIERGRVHVLLQIGRTNAGESKRLRTYGPGTVVGEMGFFSGEPRSADIVAEVETEALCITRERLDALEASHPELARAIHRHVIHTLSQRVRSANDEIRLLL